MDGTSVEKKLLRERSLTRVRVGNDGESASP